MKPGIVEVDERTLRAWPLPLPDEGDKEGRGRVLMVAGSREIPGAAVLAATAALRAGAGKVAIATPASIAQSVAFAVPESRIVALEENGRGEIVTKSLSRLDELAGAARAVLIGPGLLNTPAVWALTAAVLEKCAACPIILDAGAMGIVRSDAAVRFSTPVLVTPHAGEMASLLGVEKDAVERDARDFASDAARRWNALVALKGRITYVAAPDARVWRHAGGNVGLATSGSGDVLAGIIAGLAARGAPLEQAAVWGVALHARAGDRLASSVGLLGYLARELPAEVPALMAELTSSAQSASVRR